MEAAITITHSTPMPTHIQVDFPPVAVAACEAGGEKTTYAQLDTEKAKKIVAEHLQKGRKVDNLAVGKQKKTE